MAFPRILLPALLFLGLPTQGAVGDEPKTRADRADTVSEHTVLPILLRRCANCHGAEGAGDGPLAGSLDPPPTPLANLEALWDQSPLDFYRKVTLGVAGTAMPSFEESLSEEERWAVSWYATQLRGRRSAVNGASVFADACARCDSAATGKMSPLALLPPDLVDPRENAKRTDEELAYLVAEGALGRPVPDSAAARAVVSYLRTLPFAESQLRGPFSLSRLRPRANQWSVQLPRECPQQSSASESRRRPRAVRP